VARPSTSSSRARGLSLLVSLGRQCQERRRLFHHLNQTGPRSTRILAGCAIRRFDPTLMTRKNRERGPTGPVRRARARPLPYLPGVADRPSQSGNRDVHPPAVRRTARDF
jgi:hypothetical protein